MDITAIDSKNAGIRNEKLVISLLRKEGVLSQSQICKKTGLGSSTITSIVGRLRMKELILEKTGHSSMRGAKPVLIEINPDAHYIMGAEINPSYLLIGLFDFKSSMVDCLKVSLEKDLMPENVIDMLEVNIKGILSKHTVSSDKLTGVGITLSGSISSEGVVLLSSPLGWSNVHLKQLLGARFDAPVNIYTTKVRLFAEMNVDPPLQSENIVYLNVANGVGATVIVDGHLINGSTNQCGELGHVVVDPEGPVCGCGQRGCLEAHISGPALVKKIKNDISKGSNTVLSEMISEQDSPEQIAQKWKLAIEKDDQYGIMLRDYVGNMLSRAAAVAINLYDPDTLILAGYINMVCADRFAECIRNRFETDVYDQSSRTISVVTARVEQEALIRGVAEAVLQEQFNSR